jgi:mRNA interferase HigB
MKIHLIKRQTIEEFVSNNTQCQKVFHAWISVINCANWEFPQDIVSTFNHADLLGKGSNRVVFNIGGNKYRMICKYYFGKRKVHLFVKWIGTHAQYDKLCNERMQYDVNEY